MIGTYHLEYGWLLSARSDDALVTALSCPSTPLYGNYELRDETTGRRMWRGLYPDADGYYRAERVPEHIWASAVKLMAEADAVISARSDELRHRNEGIINRRSPDGRSEQIAADMDRPNSKL